MIFPYRKATKRPQVFTNQTLQIDLGKKKGGKGAKKKTPKKTSRKTPLKKISPVKKTPVKRVRRNLSFDNKEKPKKDMKTVFNKTPSKKTPRKGDFSVLVPETPDKGNPRRRKSDGVQIVKESPNVDVIKQKLRRKTTFYSESEVSRSVKAAEEKVQELQNFNPLAKVPMKRLFQYTEDNEITIKSPFKFQFLHLRYAKEGEAILAPQPSLALPVEVWIFKVLVKHHNRP